MRLQAQVLSRTDGTSLYVAPTTQPSVFAQFSRREDLLRHLEAGIARSPPPPLPELPPAPPLPHLQNSHRCSLGDSSRHTVGVDRLLIGRLFARSLRRSLRGLAEGPLRGTATRCHPPRSTPPEVPPPTLPPPSRTPSHPAPSALLGTPFRGCAASEIGHPRASRVDAARAERVQVRRRSPACPWAISSA